MSENESTMVCIDNSDYMRNGDYMPTRLAAQKEACQIIINAKTNTNEVNNVGLLTLNRCEVLATLHNKQARPKVLQKLNEVTIGGDINLLSSLKVAHLVLKHRMDTQLKMRIIVFVGSPISNGKVEDFERLAKKLKKDKVQVDVISFGEEAEDNEQFLKVFVETLNGGDNESGGSHFLSVPPGRQLPTAVRESPVLGSQQNLVAAGGVADIDENDPELAMALRLSLEDQRNRVVAEGQQAVNEGAGPSAMSGPAGGGPMSSEDAALHRVLEAQMQQESFQPAPADDLSEEAQLQLAIEMSLMNEPAMDNASATTSTIPASTAIDLPSETPAGPASTVPPTSAQTAQQPMDVDFTDLNRAAIDSALGGLEGIDPSSQVIQDAIKRFESEAAGQPANKDDSNKKDQPEGGSSG